MGKKGKPPKIKSHMRQVLVCMDGDCAKKADAKAIRKQFKKHLAKAQSEPNVGRSLCTGMDCVGPCRGGPIVVVWPDGVWYQGVDEQAVDRIINEHIIGGIPVEDYLLYQVPSREPAGD